MKNSRYPYVIAGLAVIVGFIVYLLFNFGVFTLIGELPFFITTVVIGAVSLISWKFVRPKKDISFCGCGALSAFGAFGTTLLSLLLSLVAAPTGTVFFIGMGVLFFFIVLMLGGTMCYLYNSNACGCQCD